MILKNKLLVSYLITGVLIVILAAYEYVSFIDIRKEIQYLEMTDTVRSKCLQLRRHEKNFFIYGASEMDTREFNRHLNDLRIILANGVRGTSRGKIVELRGVLDRYSGLFKGIETESRTLAENIKKLPMPNGSNIIPILELSFMEHPQSVGMFLRETFALLPDNNIIAEMERLDASIRELRRYGEKMVTLSNELDKMARANVNKTIETSQLAILVFVPLFLIAGISMSFLISANMANRLNMLATIMESTGKGIFDRRYILPDNWNTKDEIGMVFDKFNEMATQLKKREVDIENKNRELLQTKKLAAIGTLTSGVAHELNNPLNNIYLSAQVLLREAGEGATPYMLKTIRDMMSQTKRVKGIIGDLLYFARGRELVATHSDINRIIRYAFKTVAASVDVQRVEFSLICGDAEAYANVDPEQIERVFINLFTNAVESMKSEGTLTVEVQRQQDVYEIMVSDTGPGIDKENMDKIFEPFFSTKEKGTGLGLSIVYNIIQKHGGDIRVDRTRQATFIITLPVEKDGAKGSDS
ncbi:MAG: GHKL domain-containing protein [Nitrospirae bacterium]|nr:GHKL domain-containing protein [Nitrospirota bacterium]MBF0591211.1 GHKL domain-containing protein [Nitrospirota bacterium]